jgi:hypothetical protein
VAPDANKNGRTDLGLSASAPFIAFTDVFIDATTPKFVTLSLTPGSEDADRVGRDGEARAPRGPAPASRDRSGDRDAQRCADLPARRRHGSREPGLGARHARDGRVRDRRVHHAEAHAEDRVVEDQPRERRVGAEVGEQERRERHRWPTGAPRPTRRDRAGWREAPR